MPATSSSTRPLSARKRRILRAVIAAIRPRGHGFDQPIDDYVLDHVESFLRFLPITLRIGLPWGLELIELGPPVFARRWVRFTDMSADDGEAYLAHWHEAGGLRGTLLLGLRTLVFLAFYQHPDVLAVLEVDWAGRARALVRRRAELLDEHAA
jgi:hypothetical protein